MTCLDEKIKRKLKSKNFKKVFQLTKIIKFEIYSKKKKIANFTLFEIPNFAR